ncbi:MAG: hypothetical protein ACKOAH_00780, partial [Pirellula sp.]
MIRGCYSTLLSIKLSWLLLVSSLAWVALLSGQLRAQGDLDKVLEEIEVPGSLMDEEPFDVIT